MTILAESGTDQVRALGERIRARLEPGRGERPGRPSDPSWTVQRKLSMNDETLQILKEIAEAVSTDDRRVSPMHVASLLIEEATQRMRSETNRKG